MKRIVRLGSASRRLAPVFVILALGAGVSTGATKPGGATPPTSTRNSPGWYPSVDPESMSVVIGRRTNAPLVAAKFTGGASSLDDLGRRVCRALHHETVDSLERLIVTADEFRDILWREFPQSRPATGLSWEDGWIPLTQRLTAGTHAAVRDHGRRYWTFVKFEVDSVAAFRNFRLHSRIRMVVRDDTGRVTRWNWIRAIVERRGAFKIYSTDD